MACQSKSNLILILATAIAGLLFHATPPAHAQRRDRDSRGDAAQADRDRDDDDGDRPRRRGRGRRGRGRDRAERRNQDANDNNEADEEQQSSDARSSTDNRSDADRLRGYAVSIVEKYDKNGDKMLQADERAEMRGKPAEADLNNDEVITIDELVMHLSPKSGTSAPVPSSSNDVMRSVPRGRNAEPTQRVYGATSSSENDKNDRRKSYRFTSPTERLPAGLPSWFKSRDANGDGQVAMHEYSHTWNDRTAARFVRYDKNNDGIITAEEASER